MGQFGVGLGGSVFANGYPSQAAFTPAATGLPEGPSSITQRAFGVPSGIDDGGQKGLTVAGLGTLALAVLVFIWWSLPK